MANRTNIQWADVTVNPFPGCRKVSPGCEHCYAERMARRLKAMGVPAYQDVVDANGWTGRVGCNLEAMKVPGKGKLVFVNSMGDLFYPDIPYEQFARCMLAIEEQPQHTFQLLTKRPKMAHTLLEDIGLPDNCWLGVTAENQEWADKRIPILLRIPAAVRFVSLEPLLGPIAMLPYFADIRCSQCGWFGYGDNDTPEGGLAKEYDGPGDEDGHWECPNCGASEEGCVCDYSPVHDPYGPDPRINWVIVGCESGPKRRPCETQWVANIVAQCTAADVPVFVKQISIAGEVVHDADRIALELSDCVGRPLCVEDIRQMPKGAVHQEDVT